jgi:hypothetical protein
MWEYETTAANAATREHHRCSADADKPVADHGAGTHGGIADSAQA